MWGSELLVKKLNSIERAMIIFDSHKGDSNEDIADRYGVSPLWIAKCIESGSNSIPNDEYKGIASKILNEKIYPTRISEGTIEYRLNYWLFRGCIAKSGYGYLNSDTFSPSINILKNNDDIDNHIIQVCEAYLKPEDHFISYGRKLLQDKVNYNYYIRYARKNRIIVEKLQDVYDIIGFN